MDNFRNGSPGVVVTALPPHPLEDPQLNLFQWQEEAFRAWEENNHRGIVEAVTGAGKTRLGIAAISAALGEGRQVLLLVPTIELLHQWFREVRNLLPWARVGRLGDQHRDDFLHHQVIISTLRSALLLARRSLKAVSNNGRLLLVDEVHRVAAEQFAEALDLATPWRLGLTATYERPDERHLTTLDPYFGGVIFKLWYDRAQRDHLIAPFDIALVGVDLTPAERVEYKRHTEIISRSHRALKGYLKEPVIRGDSFLAIVAGWAADESMSARTVLARRYIRAVSARQRLLAQTHAKLDSLPLMHRALAAARSTLLFSLTQDGATKAAEQVSTLGVSAAAVFSEISGKERRQRMDSFRRGTIPVLSAPRVLDEGVDVPEAELAVVLAANRSKRQLVQRLGRVIRRKSDGRAGKFIFLYATGTVEDPDIAGDEHLNEILPHARELGWFHLPEDVGELLEFLENTPPSALPPLPTAGTTPKRAQRVQPETKIIFGVKEPAPKRGSKDQHSGRSLPVEEAIAPEEKGGVEDWGGEVPELLAGRARVPRDLTKMYFGQIGRYPLLTAEKEIELGREIEAGLFAGERLDKGEYSLRREYRDLETLRVNGLRAHRRFVCSNLRLVVRIAKFYIHSAGTLDFLDLIQEGNFGLEKAVQKWDYKRGHKFSTYATWWIKQTITRAVDDTSRQIRLPVHKAEELKRAKNAFANSMDAGLTEVEARAHVAAELELTVDEVRHLFDLDRLPVRLDQPWTLLEHDEKELTTFGAVIFDENANDIDTELYLGDREAELTQLLSVLTEKEERVIRLRHGLSQPHFFQPAREPMTLDKIGAEFGVTRERIRQIEKQAMGKLVDAVAEFWGSGSAEEESSCAPAAEQDLSISLTDSMTTEVASELDVVLTPGFRHLWEEEGDPTELWSDAAPTNNASIAHEKPTASELIAVQDRADQEDLQATARENTSPAAFTSDSGSSQQVSEVAVELEIPTLGRSESDTSGKLNDDLYSVDDLATVWRAGGKYSLKIDGEVTRKGSRYTLRQVAGEDRAREIVQQMRSVRESGVFKVTDEGIAVTLVDGVLTYVGELPMNDFKEWR